MRPRHVGATAGRRASAATMCLCLVLAGCASSRTSADVPIPASERSASAIAYEEHLVESAKTQDRQLRLADERITLELLRLLRPADAVVDAQIKDLDVRIAAATKEHLRLADDAAKRGQQDLATAQYLAALSLSPEDSVAANALRAIEKERNRRLLLARQRQQRQVVPAPGQGD
jgi:hypothetical protein